VNEKFLLVVFITGTVLIVLFAVVMTVFLVINKQRQNKARLERQQLEFTFNSTLLKTKIEMQEQALEFVSQEIHDNVGQVLSFSCLQLANLKNSIADQEARNNLGENLEIIRQAVKELRLLSHSLNTSMIENRDLEEVIETELNRIRAFSPIKCALEVEGRELELHRETRLLIFRIIQEALQNVIKHAAAKSVIIRMEYGSDKLNLRIIDDGKGIDVEKIDGKKSLGMSNMQQRAKLLKGDLKVLSDGKNGTELALNIPL
jgi:signal transduction histidine kinase